MSIIILSVACVLNSLATLCLSRSHSRLAEAMRRVGELTLECNKEVRGVLAELERADKEGA